MSAMLPLWPSHHPLTPPDSGSGNGVGSRNGVVDVDGEAGV